MPVSADAIPLKGLAIPLHADKPNIARVNRMTFMGGLQLSSPNGDFGGFSGLHINSDGSTLIALSDSGRRLRLNLYYDTTGHLIRVGEGKLARLRDTEGKPLKNKKRADAEALSPAPGGGFYVAYERKHRLRHFSPAWRKSTKLNEPKGLNDQPTNSGIEALATLPNGNLLIIGEGAKGDERAPAWLRRGGEWTPLHYPLADSFRVTGAATLPDGDVLVLERRFRPWDGVTIRIRRIPAAAVRGGSPLTGPAIAELRPPLNVDNFEGIATRTDGNGRQIVYIISDDNFSPLQRTLLMMFELME